MKFYPDDCDKVNNIRWYSLKRVFSFCVKFMYLIGGRRYGKTYSIKTFVLKDFIKHGHKFAWFRTTETALDRIRDPIQFFGRMKNLKELGINHYDIIKDVIYLNREVAGYLFPISTFHNIKGADYECVNGVWDEFMKAKGERPVPNKRAKFFDAVESVFRDTGSRIFCISNSTNQFDEMLEPFDLTLKDYGCYLFREENAVVHYVQPSKTHAENAKDSLSYIGMTEEDKKMAFSNKFTSYGDYGKMAKSRYVYSLQVDDNKFIHVYVSGTQLFINNNEIANMNIFTLTSEYVSSKVKRLSPANKKTLIRCFDNGQVVFSNGFCRTMFQEAAGLLK